MGGLSAEAFAFKVEQLRERIRLTRVRRLRIEHDTAMRARELVRVTDVKRCWREIFAGVQLRFRRLPDMLAARCDMRKGAEVAAILREGIDECPGGDCG